MSPVAIGILGIFVVLFLMACGMPVGFAMLLIGFTGFAFLTTGTAALNIVATVPFEVISKYDLLVLPMFLLMASIFFNTGMGQNLYKLAYSWMGHLPGGLAIATVGACAVFAAISASSPATALTMGVIAIPEMRKYKYDNSLATGCVAAGGTLGILIPPSGCLIIYGILTEQSIVKLFAAGIVPGIIVTLFFFTVIYVQARLNPRLGPPGPSVKFNDKIRAMSGSWDTLLLIVLVLGGLFIGFFTPTEAGAVGAFGAALLSIVRKRLNLQGFKQAVLDTARDSGMLFTIVIGALVLNSFLTASTMPMELTEWIASLQLHPILVMGVIVITYVVLGCFIDSLAMIMLTIPIFYPLALNLGYDPIWFGVLVVLVNEVAMITPPVGINVWVLSGVVPDIPMHTIFKGIFPFFGAMVVFIALLILFPQIALFVVQFV